MESAGNAEIMDSRVQRAGEGRHPDRAGPGRECARVRCRARERGLCAYAPSNRPLSPPPPARLLWDLLRRPGLERKGRGWGGGGGRTRSGLAAGLDSAPARGRGTGDHRSSPLAFERSSWANGRRGDAPGLVQALC